MKTVPNFTAHSFILGSLLGAVSAPVQADTFAYVANTGSDDVSVINTATNAVEATVAVGSSPWGVAITPDGAFAYITNRLSDSVSVINTATNAVDTTVMVGDGPRGVAITPDGAFAYVANFDSGNVSVINTATNAVDTTVMVASNSDGPRGVAITPDGAFVYVTVNGHPDRHVAVINTATNAVEATVMLHDPVGVAITPDGAFAYVVNSSTGTVSVINTATNAVHATVDCFHTCSFPLYVAITPDGAFAYFTEHSPYVWVINTATMAVDRTLVAWGGARGVAFTPDGAYAYFTVNQDYNNPGNVWVINTATSELDATVIVGNNPLGVAITPVSITTEQTFADVPRDHWAFSFIGKLAASGITSDCGGGYYCPNDPVTRAEMAMFLERGLNGSAYVPPAATGNTFLDVGANDFAADFIEQFYMDGITSGCGGNNYCPTDSVTRAQMAVFLLRVVHGSGYLPPAPTGTVFSDVNPGYWTAAWIEQLAAEGITAGCGGGNYCPEAQVTRDQMAVFLVRIFEL